ncbi:MAG: hypothetical protein HXX81_03605 [Campylobacterales bacterium]|nr:hypothetical protein [Campylobacterales bacterium]
MYIDGDRLEIGFDIEVDEFEELKSFIMERLNYIDSVNVTGDDLNMKSSTLIQFLASIKKSKPTIKINLFDSEYCFKKYQKIDWNI